MAGVTNPKANALLAAFGDLPSGAVVIEIGCARFREELPSDGWSTVHLARAALEHGWDFHSVDIDPAAVKNARALTDGLPVNVHECDGERWLRAWCSPIDGLYLDGAAEPQQAVAQYEAANLADGVVIAIDDVQPIGEHERGKGDLLLDRLEGDGFDVMLIPTFERYQMAVATR